MSNVLLFTDFFHGRNLETCHNHIGILKNYVLGKEVQNSNVHLHPTLEAVRRRRIYRRYLLASREPQQPQAGKPPNIPGMLINTQNRNRLLTCHFKPKQLHFFPEEGITWSLNTSASTCWHSLSLPRCQHILVTDLSQQSDI